MEGALKIFHFQPNFPQDYFRFSTIKGQTLGQTRPKVTDHQILGQIWVRSIPPSKVKKMNRKFVNDFLFITLQLFDLSHWFQ